MDKALSYISLGGLGEVTKNLHVYQFGDEILLVDCGLGFADETMIGVDLLLPDISYLQKAVTQNKKRIVGMVISHGHEDHMGALPFVLPQLPEFPIYGSSFTAAMANQKLEDFGLKPTVREVSFNHDVQIGSFIISLIHVTHSIPDTSHVVIKTPVGNFYHGSDFKFDLTPFGGKKTDFQAIAKVGSMGIRCLMSECLGSERLGYTPSEKTLQEPFIQAIRDCQGKCIVTTYSSNISRLQQIISIAESMNKRICFVGRSIIKTKELARQKGLLSYNKSREVQPDQVKRYKDNELVLFVAGSQGQENSALTRIVNGEHRSIQLHKQDVIIFSADPIPGNEVSVYSVIDAVSRLGIKVLYSDIGGNFHVSGHGSSQELMLLMSLVKPRQVLPISGGYRHMVAYRELAKQAGFTEKDIILAQEGQEIIFYKDRIQYGQKIPLRHIYVDEISGEQMEHFVLHDRQRISQEGIVAIIAEIEAETGILTGMPEIVSRGLPSKDSQEINKIVAEALKKAFPQKTQISDWNYLRKQVREVAEKAIFEEFSRRPLVLPVVIEM